MYMEKALHKISVRALSERIYRSGSLLGAGYGGVSGLDGTRMHQRVFKDIKNEYGTIYIAEDVMLKVVGYAALECYGIVAMSGQRATDGIVEWLGRENLTKGVQIRNVGDMLDVDLYIIVEYGISISEVCKTIIETVRYKLESTTGVKVRKISISVEGIRI